MLLRRRQISTDKALPAVGEELPEGEPLEIEITNPETVTVETPDGGAIVLFGDDPTAPPEFDANLAEHIDEDELQKIASDLISMFDADKASRRDWEQTYVKGLELLGTKFEERTIPWSGACGVGHPLLAEAAVRFQATSIMETFPAAGPVKTKIQGAVTVDREKQAKRVQEDMNWLLTDRMTEFRPEHEKMLFNLALGGTAVKKVYYDPTLGRPVSMFVPAEDFVIPYGASDLRSAPRYTHVMRRYANEVRKLQATGFYRDVDLPEPSPDYGEVQQKRDRLTSDEPSVEHDDRHTLLEMHVEYDLPGFEDEKDGEQTGIALPYVVTIDKSSSTILSIRRNWREDDDLKVKRIWFTDYHYIPAFGFYSFGLIHLIGGITKSSTSILRQLIDAGTLSNLPGGLKSRGLRIKGDSTPIMPGEFRDVDVPSGAIKDAITFLPYKEPSAVLAQLLGSLVEEGRRFASISEMEIGDSNQEAPVGTTLALMERAMKVQSAVQARAHASMRRELSLLVEIVRDNLPAEYEYETDPGATRTEDYDDRVDILPVSDPNATTMSQRVVQYQAALQLAAQAPQMYDLPELHRQMLGVLGIQNVEKIIPSTEEQPPVDPVTENMNILAGKPVKAFLYQDHEAHIRVHMAAMQDPKIAALVGQSPQASTIMGAAQAHVAEHLGFAYRKQIEKQMGVSLPAPEESLPEDVEVQLSKLVADAADRLLAQNKAEAQQQQIQQQQQDPIIQMQQQELRLKEEELKRKQAKDMVDAKAEAERLRIERERIASQERQSGARIGLDAVAKKEAVASKERVAGAQIGLQAAQQARQAQMPQRPNGAGK